MIIIGLFKTKRVGYVQLNIPNKIKKAKKRKKPIKYSVTKTPSGFIEIARK